MFLIDNCFFLSKHFKTKPKKMIFFPQFTSIYINSSVFGAQLLHEVLQPVPAVGTQL